MMKKISIIVMVLIFLLMKINASPKYLGNKYFHTDEYATVCISEDTIEFDDSPKPGKLVLKKEFDCFQSTETNFIILNCTVSETYFLTLIKKNKLTSYPYSCWEMTYVKTMRGASYNRAKLVPFRFIKASSFITEIGKTGGEIQYIPGDCFSLTYNPWAVKESEKKEVYISSERWRNSNCKYYPIKDIVFVNGFVFPDKEYLYGQNSRAKMIRISYDNSSFDVELQDIGNFQVIHLPQSIDPVSNTNIKIEILSYYPGTKYSDIVISGIYYMDAEVSKTNE